MLSSVTRVPSIPGLDVSAKSVMVSSCLVPLVSQKHGREQCYEYTLVGRGKQPEPVIFIPLGWGGGGEDKVFVAVVS